MMVTLKKLSGMWFGSGHIALAIMGKSAREQEQYS